jgi:HK97 gp10 family phage protein
MATMKFEVLGYREVDANLSALSKKGAAVETAALEAGAKPILERIVAKAPERTGRGKRAIKIGRIRTFKGSRYISVGVHKEDHKDGRHMIYQEFGTSRHKAQPFIRTGFAEAKAEAFSIIAQMFKGGLGL